MKLLVTGASGLLGANFLLEAWAQGHHGWAQFHQYPVNSSVLGFSPLQLDLAQALSGLESLKPDWIVHCAAMTSVDGCESKPAEARRLNADLTGELAVLAREVGARLLYISTDSVFDGAGGPFSESDPTGPLNAYATTKLLGEVAAGPQALILRTAFYGMSFQPKLSLVEWILSRLESGQTVPGFVDALFTPILVNDLCQIMLELMEGQQQGVFHVGSPDELSKFEFARRVAAEFGFDPNRVIESSLKDSPLFASRPARASLNCAKLAGLLGRRLPTVAEGVKRLKADGLRRRLDKLRLP